MHPYLRNSIKNQMLRESAVTTSSVAAATSSVAAGDLFGGGSSDRWHGCWLPAVMNSHSGTAPLLSVVDLVAEKCLLDDVRMNMCRDGGGWRRLPAAGKAVVAANAASGMVLLAAGMRPGFGQDAAGPLQQRARLRRERCWSLGELERRARLQASLVRLWARAVTQTCLVSCRGVYVDRATSCLMIYKAIGRNFSPPTWRCAT